MIIIVNCLSLLFLTSLVYMAVSTTYYVIPDHYSLNNYTNSNTFTLQHYLNNTSKYFVSHNKLHFLPGQYYINSDLVFEKIYTFTLTGHGINESIITCSSPASIRVRKIESFILQNIALIDCQKLLKSFAKEFYVSVLFYYCSSVTMKNTYVNVSSNPTTELIGICMINVTNSEISNITMHINILACQRHPIDISGLTVHYIVRVKVWLPGVIIKAFNYHPQKSCLKYSQCAIKCMTTSAFLVSIQNTVFANLINSSALYYYGSVYSKLHNNTQRTTYLWIKISLLRIILDLVI